MEQSAAAIGGFKLDEISIRPLAGARGSVGSAGMRAGARADGRSRSSGWIRRWTRLSLTDAKIEILGEHFGLTEGPVWMQEAARRVSSVQRLRRERDLQMVAGNAPLSVFLEKSGYTGKDTSDVGEQTVSGRLAILLIGSNGLALDPQGRLIITAMADRNVTRLEKDGTRTVLADRYRGQALERSERLVMKSDGAVYFTDSVFGLRGGAKSPRASCRTTASFASRTERSRCC